eukprot:8413465-Pyramimonas_sp.AAC.1
MAGSKKSTSTGSGTCTPVTSLKHPRRVVLCVGVGEGSTGSDSRGVCRLCWYGYQVWGVECTLAVIGTGGPIKRSDMIGTGSKVVAGPPSVGSTTDHPPSSGGTRFFLNDEGCCWDQSRSDTSETTH